MRTYFQRETFEPANATCHAVDENQTIDLRGVLQLKRSMMRRCRFERMRTHSEASEDVRTDANTKADGRLDAEKTLNERLEAPFETARCLLEMVENIVHCFGQLVHGRISRTKQDQRSPP